MRDLFAVVHAAVVLKQNPAWKNMRDFIQVIIATAAQDVEEVFLDQTMSESILRQLIVINLNPQSTEKINSKF